MKKCKKTLIRKANERREWIAKIHKEPPPVWMTTDDGLDKILSWVATWRPMTQAERASYA